MSTRLKTTPLYDWHKAAGANLADFGGFDMPLWYETGVKNEHLAVLKSAGIFDTSHMACINVNGKDSFDLINYCFTRNIDTLKKGHCVYGAFLNTKGHCIDDAIVYKFSDYFFMICVNAGMGAAITRHLEINKANLDVSIEDLSEKTGKMDIQGKNSARILFSILQNPEAIFNQMPYFSFKGNFNESILGESEAKLMDGTPVLLSRSGYTGEFGFEIFLNPKYIAKLWKDILSAGKDYGISACGLGARDSLRVGACLPLSHQDIGSWKFLNHPWEFALPFTDDKASFTKDFLGAESLLSSKDDPFIYPFVGDSLRKVSAGENTHVIDETNNVIGKVLTCATDMGITRYKGDIVSINSKNLPQDLKIKGISCGFVMVTKKLEPARILTLKGQKRKITATIVADIRPDRTARKKINNFNT
ncbi:MAG: aminomethyl transferase family protein [Desulfobacula sp.]|nr:aminomethyl transferase family protein [Desulfobacula sp.]